MRVWRCLFAGLVVCTILAANVVTAQPPARAAAAATVVLGWTPGVPSGAPLQSPLTLYFNRQIDAASVERVWRITPAVPGRFTAGRSSVTFMQAGAFHPNTTYALSVGAGAVSTSGVPIVPFAVRFRTGAGLRIARLSPAPKTEQVPVTSTISVAFNRPMVALSGVDAESSMPKGWSVSISPSVQGHASWLGTSTWVFHPQGTLRPATRYTVTLHAGARDSMGESLSQTRQWTFTTATPEVYSRSPRNGSQYTDPATTVRVTFSQPMDHGSTASAFTVKARGARVPGSISWSGATVIFHPLSPLVGGRTYHVSVSRRALSANRKAPLQRSTSWQFRVAPSPRFESSEPASGHIAWAQPPWLRYQFCCVSSGYGTPVNNFPYSVSFQFNTPMSKASLDAHLHISPSVGKFTTSLGTQYGDWIYTINGDFNPSTSYTVSLDPGVVDAFGRPLPAAVSLTFTTSERYPTVALYGMPGYNIAAFSSGQVVRAPLQTINVPKVKFQLIKTTVYALNSYGCDGCPPAGKRVRTWSEDTGGGLNQIANPGVDVKSGSGAHLTPGVYWLGAQSSGPVPGWHGGPTDENWPPHSSEAFLVNNVSITVTSASNGTLAWVSDSKTGKPLSGTTVRLIDYNGATIASGKTDSHGLHFFGGYSQNSRYHVYGATVRSATRFGMAQLYWQANTTSPTYFTWPWQPGGPDNGTYVYTDRPIYRAGQTVHFRALLWRDQDAVYSRLPKSVVSVSVRDSRYKQIFSHRFTLDRFGAISGSFHIPSGAPTGDFNIWVGIKKGPNTGTTFTVAQYRKPEFLTTVTAGAPRYAQGQTATARVSVQYVFGAPVTHERVHWIAYSNPTEPSPPGWDGYTFVNWEQYWTHWWELEGNSTSSNTGLLGKQIASGTGSTDGKGMLTIRMPVGLKKDRFDRNVTVEVTATDRNAQSVSGRATLSEFHSDLAIGVQADADTIKAGTPATVHVVTVHQSGAAAPDTHLTVTINRRTYTSKLVSVQGQTQWQPVPTDTPIATQTLTTDAQGKGTLTYTPSQGGEYYIVISGADSLGNTTQTSLSIYATTDGTTDWNQTENTSIVLKPDHQTYEVGQTAHVLVPAPFAGANALVTVARGTIRKYWTAHFSGTSGIVDVPLGIDAIPNEYVTVTLYHGWRGTTPPEWRTGTAELHLHLDPRHIMVRLRQNGGPHRPGGHVSYTVTTTVSGKPVSAEVSLALVDTSVLALKDATNADILQAFYAEQPLGATTASEGAVSIDNLTQRADFALTPTGNKIPTPGMPKPGGGGGGFPPPVNVSAGFQLGASSSKSAAGTQVKLRTRFSDTAYWRGGLVTNGTGVGRVSLTLPDNTTTWRLDARAANGSQAVGGGTLKTLATRDLVLRPVLPRFFVQGDRLRVGVALNNRLKRTVRVRVSLSASGLHLAARPETVSIPARGEHLFLFPASVPVSSAAVLTARATPVTSGVGGDAVQQVVPVHAPLTDETTAATGQVYDTTRQLVVVPRNAVSVPGSLTVTVQSSITAGLGAAYGQLRPSPYESNDDVADRVLAASALHTLPQPITGLSVKSYRHLPLAAALGVQKLLDTQWYDGGWPWFTDPYTMQSDPLVTADAVQALVASGRHGPLVQHALGRARTYLMGQLARAAAPLRAHMLAIMAEAGWSGPTTRLYTERLYADSIRRLHLDAGALADLGAASLRTGDGKHARSVLAALQASARVSATGAHWESANGSFWGGPPIENTATVLTALLRLSPNDPLEPATARWLMLARRGDGWDCGRDTAQAIASLAAYARATAEGKADYHYRVVVPTAAPLQGWYTPKSTTFTNRISIPVKSLHRPGATRIDISRSASDGSYGTGPLYYLTRLHYYLPANAIAARDEGVSVSRQFLNLAGHPVSSVRDGSAVKVRLTVHTDQTLVYLNLRDPLCSGCEPIDETLKTSQQGIGVQPTWNPWQRATGTQDLTWYLIHSDMRDDQVDLYAYYLPPGTYRYTYLVQATVAGRYDVPPTHASEQFFPEVFGRSKGQVLTIR